MSVTVKTLWKVSERKGTAEESQGTVQELTVVMTGLKQQGETEWYCRQCLKVFSQRDFQTDKAPSSPTWQQTLQSQSETRLVSLLSSDSELRRSL